MDKEHWGDPETFRPERFLDTKGNIIQDDWLIPFGLGKLLAVIFYISKHTNIL